MTIDPDKVLTVYLLVLVEAMMLCVVRHEGICFKVHRAETDPCVVLVGQLRSLATSSGWRARGSSLDGLRAEQTPRISPSLSCLGISEHQATTSDDALQNDTITLLFLIEGHHPSSLHHRNPRWDNLCYSTIIVVQYHLSICYCEPHRLRITSQGSLDCTAHHHDYHSRILPLLLSHPPKKLYSTTPLLQYL